MTFLIYKYKVKCTATYGHVFPLKSLHLLSHDVLQDLKVQDLSQLQTILCEIYRKQRVTQLSNTFSIAIKTDIMTYPYVLQADHLWVWCRPLWTSLPWSLLGSGWSQWGFESRNCKTNKRLLQKKTQLQYWRPELSCIEHYEDTTWFVI